MTRSSLNVPEEDLTTYLVVDRRSSVSRWGKGNSKLGRGVYTYDRLPSRTPLGTCPGSTDECEAICYAKRLAYNEPVWELLRRNSADWHLPTLPSDAKLVRIHVSGDFDSNDYTLQWINMVQSNPDVTFWGYTRTWRVPHLYGPLTVLRDEPNVQLFASVDSTSELPPKGWRIAWIDGDQRLGVCAKNDTLRHSPTSLTPVCPEETGRKPDCESCRYCFDGKRGDIVFLKH